MSIILDQMNGKCQKKNYLDSVSLKCENQSFEHVCLVLFSSFSAIEDGNHSQWVMAKKSSPNAVNLDSVCLKSLQRKINLDSSGNSSGSPTSLKSEQADCIASAQTSNTSYTFEADNCVNHNHNKIKVDN